MRGPLDGAACATEASHDRAPHARETEPHRCRRRRGADAPRPAPALCSPRLPCRRDSLLALFWPELDQEHARTALRQALRVLRTALGSGVLVNRGDEDVGLDFEQVLSDVAAFVHAIDAGAWLEATDLYRGPLLEGFFI